MSLSAGSHLQPSLFQRLIGYLIVPKDRQRSLSTWHPLCVSPAIDPMPPPLCPASLFSKPLPPVGCASNYRISHTTGPLRPLSKPPDNSREGGGSEHSATSWFHRLPSSVSREQCTAFIAPLLLHVTCHSKSICWHWDNTLNPTQARTTSQSDIKSDVFRKSPQLFTLKMPLMNSFDLLSSAERSCGPKRSERRTKRATPWRIISHWGVSLRRCRKWLFVFRATDWLWSAEPREMLFTTDCTIRSPSLPLLRPQSHTLTLQLTARLKTKMIPPLSFLWHHHCWSLDVYLRALTLTHLPSQLRRRSWCCRAVEKQTERKDL